jgi:hypothetical protein
MAKTQRTTKRIRKTRTAKKKATRNAKATRAAGAHKKAKAARRATAAADQTIAVTMKIDFSGGTPGGASTIRRIDSRALPTGEASVGRGAHTASWGVVSPTIRPVAFAVTITEDATGKMLLNRPQERTGADGKGAGAGRFTV